ncbi:MAG: two component transcriptional regulator, winged helix family protein [Anaerocolumna sp.]|jgi:DNA-binding response OmpR family regulator|nr:two component transcriptional regulator, winged helix family protein [Anaerocolumna sp.]
MYTILVCDDDKDIVDAIQIYLSAEGYHVIKAYDGKEALEVIKSNEIHLVLLDIMMPQVDGIRVTMKLRENNSTLPIILLTAKSEDSDKVLGLNAGADDYITKPFSPLELIARVKSALRRYTKLGSIVAEEQNIYSSGGLVVNDDRKEVYVDDELIKLTPIEYNLLKLLVKNKGRVFSINEIYELIWNEPSFGADNIVAVHIRHIREKIEINPKEPKYLKVAWGIGYKIEKY